MNDHFDAFGRDVKKVARLDHFEALVHERRAVDADLAAHRPVGVRDRLRGRDAREVLAAAEGTARGGEPELHAGAFHCGNTLQALKDGAVFAVDGKKGRAAFLDAAHEEFRPADDAFLVREKQALAAFDRAEGGTKPGRAHHGLHDAVDLGRARKRFKGRRARFGAGRKACGAQSVLQFSIARFVRNHDDFGVEAPGDVDEFRDVRVGARAVERKAVFMPREDVEGRLADRTRGAQKSQTFHDHSFSGRSCRPPSKSKA